jgi:hypothetical protein
MQYKNLEVKVKVNQIIKVHIVNQSVQKKIDKNKNIRNKKINPLKLNFKKYLKIILIILLINNYKLIQLSLSKNVEKKLKKLKNIFKGKILLLNIYVNNFYSFLTNLSKKWSIN